MEIRSTTIAYSKKKKLNLRNRETIIQRKLEELDTEICNNQNLDGNILMEFENLKNELTEIYSIKGKEAMFRSRTRWIENGEKPTKYFFNLEKRNYEKKIITQLKTTDGEIISDMTKINKEIENYYKNFLTSTILQEKINDYEDHFALFTSNLKNPKLCQDEANELEHDLTKDELLNALKGFQPGKTPGDDGFTKEFYETFFELLWRDLTDSFNEAFQTGKLSISQRRGVISLIPKDENNLMVLSNWRPITLLNVDYKILARAIAKRIEPKLPKLVHSDQTGFVKGRYIGQNVRLLNDLMEFTESNKLPGILLFIDFEKAFDTLEWPFIQHALKFLNFGPNICKWISVLYNDVESGVINGGYMTNYFRVSRGVRQGCPLSPLLFVLCVEILAQKIRQNPKITGIELPFSCEAKLSQFADDTTLICKDTSSLHESMSVLGKFGDISGLKLNRKKTKALWIGSLKNNKTKPLEINVSIDPIKVLGTYISHNCDKNNNLNFFLKIEKMETKLNIWLCRDLTLMGRTLLAKTLGISKLVYTASMLTVPQEVIKRVQMKLFNFLWKNKKDKVKREVLFQEMRKGGLNFPNFDITVKALRLSWIGRLLEKEPSTDAWKAIPNAFFEKYGGLNFLLKCNYNTKKLDKSVSLFYLEMLDYFKELRQVPVNQDSYESDLILWNNQDITIEGKSLFWKRWAENGIYYIQDILNENGKFLTFEEFNRKYNMSVNFLTFFQILASIPPNLKSKAASTLRPKNSVLDNSDIFDFSTKKSVLLSKMKCKDYYLLFQEKSEVIPTAIKSWVKHYSGIEDKWKKLFQNIPHLSADNKLRQFSFKLLHRILVTKKELKRFKISDSEDCFFCKSPDSLEHAFLECPAGLNLFQEVLTWFNNEHRVNFTPSKIQLLFKDYDLPPNTSPNLTRKFGILIVQTQKYYYSCKMLEKTINLLELKSALSLQWKAEKCES